MAGKGKNASQASTPLQAINPLYCRHGETAGVARALK